MRLPCGTPNAREIAVAQAYSASRIKPAPALFLQKRFSFIPFFDTEKNELQIRPKVTYRLDLAKNTFVYNQIGI